MKNDKKASELVMQISSSITPKVILLFYKKRTTSKPLVTNLFFF